MKKNSFKESLIFLFPLQLIKNRKFTKKDVHNIKNNLLSSFSTIYIIMAILFTILAIGLSIELYFTSDGHFVEMFGFAGLLGLIIVVFASLFCIALNLVGKYLKSDKSPILFRIGNDLLYLGVAVYMLCCVYSDSEIGYTIQDEVLSAGIIYISLLLLIQPIRWRDAVILDIGTGLGIIGMALYCTFIFGMKATLYYILIGIIYPFMAYIVVSVLFYAESQHYREILENERLNNRAYYDNLTQCKNRHALSEFLKENKNRWEKNDINLLMVLFDIDDFKLYNDQFSHLGGDYCLKSIADAIRREFPSPSLDFFRYGGEEFLLFFELEDASVAPQVMDKIKDAISNLDITAPKGAPKNMVTISLGGLLVKNVAEFSFEQEMKLVDDYLYKAKASGKDVACYNGSIIN